MLYLTALRRRVDAPVDLGRFPWTLPLVRDLESIRFRTPVTFLVGENGSGKSTLLEGIAAGMDAVAAGRRDLRRDPTLQTAHDLAAGFVFERRRHPRTALTQRYGEDPDARSHGETFLSLLQTRLAPKGLYLLDEPETPLSASRVLALIALLADCVAQDCQFIIATHSPILMAFPDATILHAEDGALHEAEWDTLDHVRVTRAFLNDPRAVLRRIFGRNEEMTDDSR